MVNDPRYPPSDQSACQQMSLPLTYDDGINLLPKRCDQDEAYFACDVEGKAMILFIMYRYVNEDLINRLFSFHM